MSQSQGREVVKKKEYRERESEEKRGRKTERSDLSETLIQADSETTSHPLQLLLCETKIQGLTG
jgi:hypothetical protein